MRVDFRDYTPQPPRTQQTWCRKIGQENYKHPDNKISIYTYMPPPTFQFYIVSPNHPTPLKKISVRHFHSPPPNQFLSKSLIYGYTRVHTQKWLSKQETNIQRPKNAQFVFFAEHAKT